MASGGWAVFWFFFKMAAAYAISYAMRPDMPDTEGPRLDSLAVQTSAYGEPIRKGYGSFRMAGNVIWSAGIEEHADKEKVGKGSKSGSHTKYDYTCSFAVALGRGPIAGIRRIWADSKLIYGQKDEDEIDIEEKMSDTVKFLVFVPIDVQKWASLSIYTGTETQMPDPIMEAHEGSGNVPGYRGLAYVVFEDMKLEDYGNRIPNLEFEIVDVAEDRNYGVRFPIPREAAQGTWVAETAYTAGQEIIPDPANGYVYQATKDGITDTAQPETWPTSFGGKVTDGTTEWACAWLHSPGGRTSKEMTTFLIHNEGDIILTESGGEIQRWSALPDKNGNGASLMWEADLRNDGNFDEKAQLSIVGARIWAWTETIYDGFNGCGYNIINPTTGGILDFVAAIPDSSFPRPMDESNRAVYVQRYLNAIGEYNYVFHCTGSGGDSILQYEVYEKDSGGRNVRKVREFFLGSEYSDITLPVLGTALATKTIDGSPRRVMFHYNVIRQTISDEVQTTFDDYSTFTSGPELPTIAQVYWNYVIADAAGLNELSIDSYFTPDLVGCEQWSLTPLQYSDGAASGANVDEIVADIFDQAGIPEASYDVSALVPDTVIGFVQTGVMRAEELLKPLMRAYQFDVVEQDWQVVCRKRGQDPVYDVAWGDLAAHEVGGKDAPEAIVEKITDETEMPLELVLEYWDYDTDYQKAVERAVRSKLAVNTENQKKLQYPIIMRSTQALQAVETLFATTWHQRKSYKISVPSDYIKAVPADVLTIGGLYRCLVDKVTVSFPNLLEISAVAEDSSTYTSESTGVSPYVAPQQITIAPTSFPVFLDIPVLDGFATEPGFYVAGYAMQAGWVMSALYRSLDGGMSWDQTNLVEYQSIVGRATTALADGPVTVVDEGGSVNIEILSNGEDLSGAALLSVLAGTNAAALGAHGRWEIISFTDVAEQSDGTYTLTNLVRGRRGTDHNTGNHEVNDTFILLEEDHLIWNRLPESSLDVALDYRLVAVTRSLESVTPEDFTCAGQALMPYSPVHVQGVRDGSDNLTISWVRRSRIDYGWIQTDIPMIEGTEQYEIDILDGTTVVRTITVTGATEGSYSAADQTTDFGSAQASVDIIIYQISTTVGRGTGRPATV